MSEAALAQMLVVLPVANAGCGPRTLDPYHQEFGEPVLANSMP